MSYSRKFLKLEGSRLFLILGIPFNPEFKIDVTCVYHFALGADALAKGNKKKALEHAEKAGVDILFSNEKKHAKSTRKTHHKKPRRGRH